MTAKMPSDLRFCWVGLTGFEPATPSSRTKCATKLRYSPWVLCESSVSLSKPAGPAQVGSRTGQSGSAGQAGVSVTRVASGRQQKRIGANGEVPRPADTCSQDGR